MGQLKIILPNDEEEKFRRLAMMRYGFVKGAMSKAAREAMKEWGESHEEPEKMEDPVGEIRGLMKGVKKTSVQLQHEAWGYIAEKYLKRFKNKR